MKKFKWLFVAIVLVTFLHCLSDENGNGLGLRKTATPGDYTLDESKGKLVMQIIDQVLTYYHYSGRILNDDDSSKALNKFLNLIDPLKNMLLEEDLQKLETYRLLIDDELKKGVSELHKVSFEIYQKRMAEAEAICHDILSKPMDLQTESVLQTDYDKLSFAKDAEQRKLRWVALLKQMVVREYMILLLEAEKKKEEKKTEKKDETSSGEEKNAGENDVENTTIEKKSEEKVADDKKGEKQEEEKNDDLEIVDYAKFQKLPLDAVLEKTAREKISKAMERRFKRINEGGEIQHFSLYINAMCAVVGPHTLYHRPADKENIDIDLTGQLVGIGAQLSEDEEEITVEKIIPGSASWKGQELEKGDVILKVAQGSEEFLDLAGMALSEAVRYIRGKKGTEVRLAVRKTNGIVKTISIIRDIVVLEASYARSSVVTDPETGFKVGYLLLPSFYLSQDKEGGRSSAEDVRKELELLKAKKIDALVFDLRNNGGGSLSDVVDMAGLFIKKGPIVQVRGKGQDREVLEDKDPSVVYDGPMAVMVNPFSASASEILAAALQDYGRAIIVGTGPQTFGKGTVQTFFNLANATSSKNDDIGSLRITIRKFYRINGQTTQSNGVVPDIVLPFEQMYAEIGERFLEYAMPADFFLPTNYEKVNQVNFIAELKAKSAKRIADSDFFKLINDHAEYLKGVFQNKTISVSLPKYLNDLSEGQTWTTRRNQIVKENKTLKIEAVMAASTDANFKESTKEAFENIEKSLRRDFYFAEAVNIIKDLIELNKKQ